MATPLLAYPFFKPPKCKQKWSAWTVWSLGLYMSKWQSCSGFTCPSGNRFSLFALCFAIDRTSERCSDRASNRAIDRTIERPSDRAMDRSSDRSSDRAIDRVIAHRPIKRSSDESNRRVTKQTPISRAPGGHLTRRLVHSDFFCQQ